MSRRQIADPANKLCRIAMDQVRDRTNSASAQWIGRELARVEDDALIRGAGQFIGDIERAGCLHLQFLRSPHAHAKILSIDIAAARAAMGVVDILTAENIGPLGQPEINRVFPTAAISGSDILPSRRVEWVGQPIAAVVADSEVAANDAMELIAIDYEDLPPEPDSELISHEWVSGNLETIIAKTACVARIRIEHAKLAPAPIEPRLTLVDCDERGRITAWISTQTPQRARIDLAKVLAVDENDIRVITPDIGGAFGGKASIYPEDIVVAAASLRLKRPVKWIGTRSEEFLAATHGRGAISTGELAVAANGKFLGLKARFDFPLGSRLAYSAMIPARNAARILPGPYDISDVDIAISGKRQHTAAVGIYRGAGRPEAAMLLERLVDESARMLNLDPIELRLKNVLTVQQLPHLSATGEVIDSGDFRELLVKARDCTDYKAMRRHQTKRRRKGLIVGIGSAIYIEPCGYGSESADVHLTADGRVVAATGSSAQGQGRNTSFSQIVAEVLCIAPSNVTVVHGDTLRCPHGIGALASRSTAIGGSAMFTAAENLREAGRQRAAAILNASIDQTVLSPAGFENITTGQVIDWRGLAAPMHSEDSAGLRSSVDYKVSGETWSSGCCIAGVMVDSETGEVSIEKLIWVDDAGTVINPMLVRGQLWGGLMQGLGEALKERLVYDAQGQLLTASFMDYSMPRARDVPDVEFHESQNPSPSNVLGAKGVGEAGCIGIPAAIANAVIDALSPFGVGHLDMPFTSEKIWKAMQQGSAR